MFFLCVIDCLISTQDYLNFNLAEFCVWRIHVYAIGMYCIYAGLVCCYKCDWICTNHSQRHKNRNSIYGLTSKPHSSTIQTHQIYSYRWLCLSHRWLCDNPVQPWRYFTGSVKLLSSINKNFYMVPKVLSLTAYWAILWVMSVSVTY